MVCKLFDKKSAGSDVNTHANKSVFIMSVLLGLAEELHKPIIRGGGWLADMQLINKFNKGFTFLLCVIDIFSKYAWVVPLKDK